MSEGWYEWACDSCECVIRTHDLAIMLSISDSHTCPPWAMWLVDGETGESNE